MSVIEAKTWYVGAGDTDCKTINEAVAAAADGDVIIVKASEYSVGTLEQVTINKALTIKVEGEKVAVDTFRVAVDSFEKDVTIEGFIFKPTAANGIHGFSGSYGILQAGNNGRYGTLTVTDCKFDLADSGVNSAGIHATHGEWCGGDTVITNCEFIGDGSDSYAIRLGWAKDVEVSGNTISGFNRGVHVDAPYSPEVLNGATADQQIKIASNEISDCNNCINVHNLRDASGDLNIADNKLTDSNNGIYFEGFRSESVVISNNEIDAVNGVRVGSNVPVIAENGLDVSGNSIVAEKAFTGDIFTEEVTKDNTLTILEGADHIFVDAAFAGKDGEVVTGNGKNYIVGKNAFASVEDAVNAACDTAVIELAAGTYDAVKFPVGDDRSITFVGVEGATILGEFDLGFVKTDNCTGKVSFTGIDFAVKQGGCAMQLAPVASSGAVSFNDCKFYVVDANGEEINGYDDNTFLVKVPSSNTGVNNVTFTDCDFYNGRIDIKRGTAGNVVSGCDFYNAPVNLSGDVKWTFTDCNFTADVDNYPDNAYLVRTEYTNIGIDGCSFELTGEGSEDDYIRAAIWVRENSSGATGKLEVANSEFNCSETAGVTELITTSVKKTDEQGNESYEPTTEQTIALKGDTVVTGGNIEDLLANSSGRITYVSGDESQGYVYEQGEQAIEVSNTVIYVNPAWSGEQLDEVSEGKYFGVNAFASFYDALKHVGAETSKIEVAGDISESLANNKEGVSITLSQDLTISGGNVAWPTGNGYIYFKAADDVEKVDVKFENIAFEAIQDIDNNPNCTKTFYVGTGVNVVVSATANVGIYNAAVYEGGKITVEAGGRFAVVKEALNFNPGSNFIVTGEVDKEGNIINSADSFLQYSNNYGNIEITNGSLTVAQYINFKDDKAILTADNSVVGFGKMFNADGGQMDWYSNPIGSQAGYFNLNKGSMVIKNGSALLVSDKATVGDNAVLSIEDSIAEIAGDVVNSGIINIENSTMEVGDGKIRDTAIEYNSSNPKQQPTYQLDNSDTVNVTTGKLDVNKLNNSGTVNVYGESTLIIDELAGDGDIVLRNGATLTGSKVPGGNVESSETEYTYSMSVNGDEAGTVYIGASSDDKNDIRSLDAGKGDSVNVTGELTMNGDGLKFGNGATWNFINAMVNGDYYFGFDSVFGNKETTTVKVEKSTLNIGGFSAKGADVSDTVEYKDAGEGIYNIQIKDSTINSTGKLQFQGAFDGSTKKDLGDQSKSTINLTFENVVYNNKGANIDFLNHAVNGTVTFDNTKAEDGSAVAFNRAFYNAGTLTVRNNSLVSFKTDVQKGNTNAAGADIYVQTGSVLTFNGNLVNSGTITVAGGVLDVDALTNSGTVEVSGKSTLVVDSLTGNAILVNDGATLAGSTVNGYVYIMKNATFSGANTIQGVNLYGGEEAKLTVASESSLTVSDMCLRDGSNLTINGTVTAKTEVSWGGTVLVDGGTLNGYVGSYHPDVIAALDLRNSGTANISISYKDMAVSVDATSVLNLTGATYENIDVAAVAYTGSETIFNKVVDVVKDSVSVDFSTAVATSNYFARGNDLYFCNADTVTVYVDAAWMDKDSETEGNQSYEFGDKVAEDKFYGINAFDTAAAAVAALSDDTEQIILTAGYETSYGRLSVEKDITLSTVGDGVAKLGTFDTDPSAEIANTVTIAEGAKIEVVDYTVLQPEDTLLVNGELTFAKGVTVFGKSTVEVGSTGVLTFNTGKMQNTVNPMTVYGKFVLNYNADDNFFPKLAGNEGKADGSLIVDGSKGAGVAILNTPVLTIGGGFAANNKPENMQRNGVLEVKNGGKVATNAISFWNGVNSKITVDGAGSSFTIGKIEGATDWDPATITGWNATIESTYKNDGEITVSNGAAIDLGTKAFTNNGTFNVNGEVTAGSFANSGILNITGNDAVITSAITGNGAVVVKDGADYATTDDITASRIYVGFDLATNEDTAASKLTVADDDVVSAAGEGMYIRSGSSVVVDGTLNAALINQKGELIVNGSAVVNGDSTDGSVLNAGSIVVNGSFSNDVIYGQFASDFVVKENGSLAIAGGKFDWSAVGASGAANVVNNGSITVSGDSQINAAFTGNAVQIAKNAVLTNSAISAELALKGAITVNASYISGTVTGNQGITVTGDTVLALNDNSAVKSITIDGKAGFLTDETTIGSIAINGKTGSELTADADVFAGNKVSKVALYLTGVDYADVIALDIDNIANVKAINTFAVTGNATAGYRFKTDGGLVYSVTEADNGLNFAQIETDIAGNVTLDDYTGSLDGLTADTIIEGKAGTAKLKISNGKEVELAAITKDADGGVNNISIGKEAVVAVSGNVEEIGKLSTSTGAELTINGAAEGTNLNSTISLGKDNVAEFNGGIDLEGGKNTFSIGARTDATVNGDVANVRTIKVASGTYKKATKTAAASTDLTTMTIYGDIVAPAMSNSITLGNYAKLSVYGGLNNSDVNVGTKIKVGKNSNINFSGAMLSVSGLTLGAGSTFDQKGGDIIGTYKNNTFSFGGDSVVKVQNIDLVAGKNTVKVGNGADITAGTVANISKLTIGKEASVKVADIEGVKASVSLSTGAELTAGAMDSISKLAIGKEAEVNVADIEGVNANISLAADAELTVTGNVTGVNKLTVAKGAELDIDGILSGTDKNDTISFANNAEHTESAEIDSIYLGLGNDKLTIGNNVVVQTADLAFGDGNDTLTLGKNAIIHAGDISGVETLKASKGAVIIASSINDDVNGDIKLNDVAGTWQNATIYDLEGVLESGSTVCSGQVYGNEWDAYDFTVKDQNSDELILSGFAPNGHVQLELRKRTADGFEAVEVTDWNETITLENGGEYSLLVSVDTADFKDKKEYEFNATLA